MLTGCCTGHSSRQPDRLQEQVLRPLAAAANADTNSALLGVHAGSRVTCGVAQHDLSPPVLRSSRVHRSCTGGGTSAGPARSSASSCCSAKASSDSRAPPLSGSCCKQGGHLSGMQPTQALSLVEPTFCADGGASARASRSSASSCCSVEASQKLYCAFPSGCLLQAGTSGSQNEEQSHNHRSKLNSPQKSVTGRDQVRQQQLRFEGCDRVHQT